MQGGQRSSAQNRLQQETGATFPLSTPAWALLSSPGRPLLPPPARPQAHWQRPAAGRERPGSGGHDGEGTPANDIPQTPVQRGASHPTPDRGPRRVSSLRLGHAVRTRTWPVSTVPFLSSEQNPSHIRHDSPLSPRPASGHQRSPGRVKASSSCAGRATEAPLL